MESQVSSNKKHYIYGLVDPDTNEIKYVGCSVNPLVRYQNHVQTRVIGNRAKWAWAKSLKERGVEARLIKLDECGDQATGRQRENEWIKTLIADGAPLTNVIYPGYPHPGKGKRWGSWY